MVESKETSKAVIAERVARVVAASLKAEKKPLKKTQQEGGSAARARKMLKELAGPENIKQDKENAKSWFEKFVGGGDEAQKADAELASKKYTSKITSKEAHAAAHKAYELRDSQIHGEAPTWLVENLDEFKGNARASEFAARIALLPRELQEDPYVLTREAHRLALSTDWASITPEMRKQTQDIINKTLDRAWALAENNPQHQEFITGVQDKEKFAKELLVAGGEGGEGGEPPSATAAGEQEDGDEDNGKKRGADGSSIVGIGSRRKDIFENIDYSFLPQESRGVIDSRRAFLNDPKQWGTDLDRQVLRGAVREIEDIMKRERKSLTRSPDNQNKMYELLSRLNGEMGRQNELDQIPNSITITWAELRSLQRHAIGAMDKWVADMMHQYMIDPSSEITQENLNRLRLKISYFLSPHFEDSQIPVVIEGEPGGQKQVDVVQEIRKSIGSQREKYFESYSAKLHGTQFHLAKRNAAEVGDKNLQDIVNRLTERDFFAFDAMYGGLVGEGAELLTKKYERYLRNADGQASYLSSEEWLNAMQDAKAEMMKRKGLYEPKYEAYLRGEYLQKDGETSLYTMDQIKSAQESGITQTYEEAVDHIIELASIKMEMWFDQTALNVRGLSPQLAFRIYGKEAPTAFRQKRPFESIVRFISFHPEIWGNIQGRPAAEAVALRNLGKLMASATPDIQKWAAESATQLRERITEAERRLKSTKYENLSAQDKRLLGEVRALFFYNLDHVGGPSEGELPEFALKLLKFKGPEFNIGGLFVRKDPLIEEFMIQHGLEIAESHLLFPYLNISSSWRRDEFSKQFSQIFGSENTKKIFVSGRLIGAAHEYFPKKYSGDPESARSKFMDELSEIAALRPEQLVKAMFEKEDTETIAWLSQRFGSRAQTWQEIMDLSETTALLNRHLVRSDESVIDFSQGLAGLTGTENSGQRGLINKMFRDTLGGEEAKNKYFQTMQEMAVYLRNDNPKGPLDRLTNIRYRSLFMLPYWNDDVSTDILEFSERLGRRDANGNIIAARRLSDILSSGTWDEQSGSMRRNHRDMAHLEKGKPLIMQAFKENEEELVKALAELFEVIVPVQGGDAAAIAVTQLLGAWEKTAAVYPKYGPLLENLANSSDFKRYGYGALSVSKSPDENMHLTHMVERHIGKIHTNHHGAAGFFDSMNAFVGTTRWGKMWGIKALGHVMPHEMHHAMVQWLDEYHPSGVRGMKIFMYPLFFAGLVAAYTATVAANEGKERAGGGGGGGGAHH